jgi:hypothetical protein
MGLFSRTKVKPRYDTVQRVLTDDLLELFRSTVETKENRAAFGAAEDTYGRARDDVNEFDRDGAFSQAVISSSRRNLIRSGAVSGGRQQTRGSLMEMGAAMNESTSAALMGLEQARAGRMQTLLGATSLLSQSAQSLSISPFVGQAISGAFSLENTRMTAQAEADSAQKAMIGKIIGGVVTGGLSLWGEHLTTAAKATQTSGGHDRGGI